MPPVCQYFLMGSCNLGLRCTRSHNLRRTPYDRRYEELPTETPRQRPSREMRLPRMDERRELFVQPEENMISENSDEYELISNINPTNNNSEETTAGTSVTEAAHEINVDQQNGGNITMAEQPSTYMVGRILNELQCHICHEIYIYPTTLNCSHTFCNPCIEWWNRMSNKCPICGILISSKTYCRILNEFLDLTTFLPDEVQAWRQSRKEEHNKK